jgi:hypothetical protein
MERHIGERNSRHIFLDQDVRRLSIESGNEVLQPHSRKIGDL